MRIRALLAALALLPALGLTAASATVAAAATTSSCPDTMIFEVGGHLDTDATAYDASNATLPAGTAFTKIHYSASIAPYPGDTVSMDDSVAEGIASLDSAVRTFHATCPGAHLKISGYSEGAIVAGDELAALSQDDAVPHDLISGVLYGDPRRPAASGAPGGIETNLPTIVPGITMKGPRGFGDLEVREICNENDGICSSANPITNLLCFANGVVGYFGGDHGYAIAPATVSGSGDTLNDQPPRIPGCGPPLPVPVATPYELYNGDPATAHSWAVGIRPQILALLPTEVQNRMNEFPWLSVS